MIKVEIPKEGIRLYAMMKAHELKHDIELKTDEQAINYLKSIGIEIINTKDKIIAEYEAELKKYKDMAAKGLEEFKDVGGCWGCGLQLQLKQNLEDIKHLKAENDRLKRENRHYKAELKLSCNELDKSEKWQVFERRKKIKYYQTLQEIKKIAEAPKPFIDFFETKTATEIEYDYAAICNKLELRLHKVLELLIKAEEE